MANPYVQSVVWLAACSGIGYILYVAITPSATDLNKLKQTFPGIEKNKSEVLKKEELYLKALQAATVEKPIYLRTKADIKLEKTDQ